MFGPNDANDICDLAITLAKHGGHVRVFCGALQLSSSSKILLSFTEEKLDEKREEEDFELERATLFCSRASGHYQ